MADAKIDLKALQEAAKVLRAHRDLLNAAIDDVEHDPDDESLHRVIEGIAHIVFDEFRSPETRGGS